MLELAAFLGNPGSGYVHNRHNTGWFLAERLVFYDSLEWKKKFNGLYAVIESARLPELSTDENSTLDENNKLLVREPAAGNVVSLPEKIHFLKPQTYMNRSGEPVSKAASFFKIKPEKIIVIHDELELALGTISLKFGGGLGGHNGLRSMKACLGTADFWRLRVGIGRPDDRLPGQGGREGSGVGIVDWVLSDFTREEMENLEPALRAAADLFHKIILFGPENFLPEYAKKKIIEPAPIN